MITKDIPTAATNVSTIWSALDEVKQHLHDVSQEHNISEVLMISVLNEWTNNQLACPID